MKIGFIGLGRMGNRMARRLVGAGHTLYVYDSSAEAQKGLSEAGATTTRSVREVADAASIVFASLPTPAIIERAILGADGAIEGSAIEIFVDLSTSGPKTARTLATRLRERNISALEAPVSGGIKGAREGTLSLMVSGPTEAWEPVKPLIELLGKPIYMGMTPGAGQTMKLVNNLMNACAIAITAEGMTIGIKAGLDPARMIEVLNASTGRNSATQDKWPRAVLPRTFDFGFATGLCLKDVRLCKEAATDLGVRTVVGDAVRDLLERTALALGENSDFTEIAKIVEAEAGLDPDRAGP